MTPLRLPLLHPYSLVYEEHVTLLPVLGLGDGQLDADFPAGSGYSKLRLAL